MSGARKERKKGRKRKGRKESIEQKERKKKIVYLASRGLKCPQNHPNKPQVTLGDNH